LVHILTGDTSRAIGSDNRLETKMKFALPNYLTHHVRRELAELYWSTGIADLALAMVMIFEPIYLFTLGYSVQQVMWFFAAVYFFYILFIPVGAKIASIKGYEHAILYSVPFQIFYWLLLIGGKNIPALIWIAPVAFAIQKSLYWPAFHADMDRYGRRGQHGRDFGGAVALSYLSFAIGPLVGGWISQEFSPQMTFLAAVVLYSFMFVPLFTTPEYFFPKPYKFRNTLRLYKHEFRHFASYLGFGEELLVLTVWPIFIFTVAQDYFHLGGVVSAATAVSSVILLAHAAYSDHHSKEKIVHAAAPLYALTWLLRPFVTTLPRVFAADSLGRIAKDAAFVPLVGLTYERGQDEHHILSYMVFFEQSLAIGKLLAAVLIALLFSSIGFSGTFVVAAAFTLLYLLL
jgi:MFS family permease